MVLGRSASSSSPFKNNFIITGFHIWNYFLLKVDYVVCNKVWTNIRTCLQQVTLQPIFFFIIIRNSNDIVHIVSLHYNTNLMIMGLCLSVKTLSPAPRIVLEAWKMFHNHVLPE